MKKMLLGIFLLLLSVWSLIFGATDDEVSFVWLSVFLLLAAIIVFVIGSCQRENKK